MEETDRSFSRTSEDIYTAGAGSNRTLKVLHHADFHGPYSTANIIPVVRSGMIKWAVMWHMWGRTKCVLGFDGKVSGKRDT